LFFKYEIYLKYTTGKLRGIELGASFSYMVNYTSELGLSLMALRTGTIAWRMSGEWPTSFT